MVCFAAFFYPIKSHAEAPDPIERFYDIKVNVSADKNPFLEIDQYVRLTNKSEQRIHQIPLVMYPNRFLKELPNLNDLNYRLLYPHGFSKGEAIVEHVTVDGVKTTMQEWPTENYPAGTLKKVVLSKAWEPKQSLQVHLRMRVRLPQKYGSFGWYRDRISLAGAWYAYVPAYEQSKGYLLSGLPPVSTWNVKVSAKDRSTVLTGRYFPKNETATLRDHQGRQVSLFFDKQDEIHEHVSRNHRVRLVLAKNEHRKVQDAFQELVSKWLDFVEKRPELSSFSSEVMLVQAPLREALVKTGEGVSYVSDRAFKVVSALTHYHATPIVAGMFYQMFYKHVSSVENSENYDVILEMLSWYWAEKFMDYTNRTNRDAREIKAIKLFSFVPIIDQLIYSPQFAFVDTFFNSVYPYDPVRDDPLRFNHRRARGRTLFVKLEDEVGVDRLNQALKDYLSLKNPFFDIARHGQDGFSTKVANWLAPRPAVNYNIQRKTFTKTPEGYRSEVVVKKHTKEDFQEPVELGVITKGNERRLYKWDGSGSEHRFEFDTKSKPKVLELDPRGRLYETDLSDNRSPPKMKFVLIQAIWNYDFNQNRPEAIVSGQFRKTYGGYNRYEVGGFYLGDSYGGQVGYTRLFGRLVDRLRLSHGVNISYQFSHVTRDNVVVSDPSLTAPALGVLTDESNLTSITLSYFTGNQLSWTNPLSGGYSSVGATLGSNLFGGDHSYYILATSGSWLWRLFQNPNHIIAVRGEMSFSGTQDMPTQAYQRLGGIFGMRGLSFTDDRFRGRHLLMASAEYRHFLNQDMDVNLGLFRVRGIQGALFADGGRVTATAQEKGNRLALGGAAAHTQFQDLFDLRNWETDIGYGLRFHIEYLGVNPSLLRFDVAKSLSETQAPLRYYFGVTQSF